MSDGHHGCILRPKGAAGDAVDRNSESFRWGLPVHVPLRAGDPTLCVCDQRTTTGVDGEVMAISISSDDDGNTWYVASEGQLSRSGDGQRFHGRQMVFRTRAQFWEAGEHEWQMNVNSSATNTDDSVWGKSMSAVTQVDENVDKVIAAVGILGPANA